MLKSVRNFIVYTLLLVTLTSVPVLASAQDRPIHQTLRFARGETHTEMSKRIVRGTSHVFHLRARKGQYMTVVLSTGENTSFTIYSIRSGQIDGADGVKDWYGKLPETGEYIIEIGTDETANYELSVAIA